MAGRTLRSRVDFLLTRWPALYAAALRLRPARDADKLAFLRLVKPGGVVFDVGANNGYYTVLFSHLTGPRGEVHAFEPVPATFERLAANLARECRFGNVRANRTAVGAEVGTAVLFLPGEDHGQASLTRHREGSWSAGGPVTEHASPLTTLDAYAAERGVRRIDFLKCDVEGAELAVLRGGAGLLERHRPVLHLEVYPAWTRDFGYGPGELAAFLAGLGYSDLVLLRDGAASPVRPGDLETLDGSANLLCFPPGGRRGRQ
ncbi:MAG TPA: FkbM family methyltransferase [Thermoanaerobaculia bacterium]|nr:FkbM family methyltransferase [Thermoanaerobaculia bacterium]